MILTNHTYTQTHMWKYIKVHSSDDDECIHPPIIIIIQVVDDRKLCLNGTGLFTIGKEKNHSPYFFYLVELNKTFHMMMMMMI